MNLLYWIGEHPFLTVIILVIVLSWLDHIIGRMHQ